MSPKSATRWPASSRNGGRHQIGMVADIVSEQVAGMRRNPQSELDVEDFDRDSLATVAQHFRATVLTRRIPGLVLLHYADMIADRRGAVQRLAKGAGIKADETLIEEIANATGFEAMRAEADRFVPEAGKGFWENDASFFDSGTIDKWRGQLDDSDLELYAKRLAELVPDVRARRWLEVGGNDLTGLTDPPP